MGHEEMFSAMTAAWRTAIDLRGKLIEVCGESHVETHRRLIALQDAQSWMEEYFDAQEQIEFVGVREGMSGDEWRAHRAFVADCLYFGFKPAYFLDFLIDTQRRFNNL